MENTLANSSGELLSLEAKEKHRNRIEMPRRTRRSPILHEC